MLKPSRDSVRCPANPTLFKTPYFGPGELKGWEIELASDYNGDDVVFQSNTLEKEEEIIVNQKSGVFLGSLNGKQVLSSGKIYFCRVRQQSSNDAWSDWSRWHQGFGVE